QNAVALPLEREAHEALNGVLVVDHEDRPPARTHAVQSSWSLPGSARGRKIRRSGILGAMIPEGVPRERRSRLASVRRNATRARRAAALLRPGPYRAGWLVVLIPAFVLLVGARTAPAL